MCKSLVSEYSLKLFEREMRRIHPWSPSASDEYRLEKSRSQSLYSPLKAKIRDDELGLELLAEDHIVRDFSCGVSGIDCDLIKDAFVFQKKGWGLFFVLSDPWKKVAGYYSLWPLPVVIQGTGKIQPCAFLWRIAVDLKFQRKGYGVALLKNAIKTAGTLLKINEPYLLLLDRLDEKTKMFYTTFGFTGFGNDPKRMFLWVDNPGHESTGT